MRHANQLLYGSRQPVESEQATRLFEARYRLKTGDPGPALTYLLSCPERAARGGIDDLMGDLLTALISDADEQHPDAVLRTTLNSRAMDGQYSNSQEGLRIAALLQSYDSEENVATHLAADLFAADKLGPLAVEAAGNVGLRSQIALYLSSGNQTLHSNLCWRLLSFAERSSRALSEQLRLTSSTSPEVGYEDHCLHLINNGRALCDHSIRPAVVMRGSWRDNPDSHCLLCKSADRLLSPGSDDPDNYTLLGSVNYSTSLVAIGQMLREQAQTFAGLRGSSKESDRQLIERLRDGVIDWIEDYRIQLGERHRRILANNFVEGINSLDTSPATVTSSRNYYAVQLLNREEISKLSSSQQSKETLLTAEQALPWFDGWLDKIRWLTIDEIEEQISSGMRAWLLSQIDK